MPPDPEEVKAYVEREMKPWTPGSWRWNHEEDSPPGWVELLGADDSRIIEVAPDEYYLEVENEADARLIALAPEMAELIIELVQGWDTAAAVLGLKLEGNALEAKTRALLARARGTHG